MDSMSLILFAQPPKGIPPDAAAAAGLGMGVIAAIVCSAALFFIIMFSLGIWHLVTMYKLFSAISPKNRDMEPGMVFLVLVPVVNIVWPWLLVFRACSSLQKEYDDRGLADDGDFGKTKGLVYLIGCITVICFPVGIVGMILYVLQMRKYLAELEGSGGGGKKKKIADDDDE